MRHPKLALFTVFGLHGLARASEESQQPLADSFVCEHPPYKPQIVSSSPLIVYINDFLTQHEREHLRGVAEGTWSDSAITGSKNAEKSDSRTSRSTYVARDAVLACIEDRALEFQGHIPRIQLEPLQLVKYGAGERYHFHTDWFDDAAYANVAIGGNRLSSFFAYVHVSNDTTGGGTNFPLVDAPTDKRWCTIVDCDEPYDRGVTFRPVEGNAVFWQNLYSDGKGDQRTLHAGLPVTSGEKIGMNIWTRQARLSEEARGPEFYPSV